MSEERIKLEMRLLALETIVVHAVALLYASTDSDPEELWKKIHQNLIEAARKQTFPGFEPEQSDLLSSELEAALDRLAKMVAGKIRHGLGTGGQ